MSKAYKRLLKYELLWHFLFWITVLFLQALKFIESDYSMNPAHCFLELGFNMIPAYLLYFWIFRLKNKKNIVSIVILMFAVNLLAFLYFDNFYHLDDPVYDKWTFVLTTLIRHVSISLFFFGLYSIKQLYQQQQEIATITTKEQQAQLRLLKSQINPHFLFNTLNTIYASALNKEDKTPDLILKLSDNFRYVLHQGQKNIVDLEKEIRHLKDYINLQKERLTNKIKVDWHEEIDNYEQLIPPLLLISFVENAFKYTSMLPGQNHNINIKVTLRDNLFTFHCDNPFLEKNKEEIDANWKKSGIGIENTKRRLQMMYPDKHEITIDSDENKFEVDLKIEL